MSGEGSREVRYTAFLSYSHKDAAAAGRLHRRLEAYRMPRRLAGTEGARGPVPDRLWPIFRDREELPAATDLSETVREALAQSGALIILCSPAAAASLWVAEEIETFRRLHPDRPILAAVLDGDPPDCFPAALRAFGRDGTWHEPLATDLRPHRDGARLGLLKLVAGITGVGLDALVQRDAARRVRRVMGITIGALLAMLVLAVLALLAHNARGEAERQRAEAERQRAAAENQIEFMLTELRDRLTGVGRIEIMTAVDRHALAYYGGARELSALPPASLRRRALVLHAMGQDEQTLGNEAAALFAFREASRITAEQLARRPNDPECVYAHAQSEYWLGSMEQARGDYQAALLSFQRYSELAHRMDRLSPNNPRYLGELAYSESNLGSINQLGFDRQALARLHFERARQEFFRLAQLQPRNPLWRVKTANAHGWIADTWYYEHRYPEARRERREQHRIELDLLREDPANRAYLYATVISTRSLGAIDIELREFGRALELLGQAQLAMDRLIALDPANLVWRDQGTLIALNQASAQAAIGGRGAARAALARARTLLAGTLRRSAAPSASRDRIQRRLNELSAQLQMSHSG